MNEVIFIALIEKLINSLYKRYKIDYTVNTFAELKAIWLGHENELFERVMRLEQDNKN